MHAIPHLVIRAGRDTAAPAVVAELTRPVDGDPVVTVYVDNGFALSLDLDTADDLADALVDVLAGIDRVVTGG